ncbi:hypothetical protein Nepgr_014067 [Nepenthes gracilis]|uniref:Uncharacterized protein n=1 Tax=Nepenthes gracilis TaxID=150966 RepID=A0AAD3XPY6_NEPGR|nr:hypothetical protein Nepgr_014067 [Nepenthes gracilis]
MPEVWGSREHPVCGEMLGDVVVSVSDLLASYAILQSFFKELGEHMQCNNQTNQIPCSTKASYQIARNF